MKEIKENAELETLKFQKKIVNTVEKSYMKKFFKKNSELKKVELSILSLHNQKLNPVRNYNCTDPKCVYHLEDVVKKYQSTKFNNDYQFSCRICNNYIKLKDFFTDISFQNDIDTLWEKYNINEIVCIAIEQNEKTFKPIFSEKEIEKRKVEEETKKEKEIQTHKKKIRLQKLITVNIDRKTLPKIELEILPFIKDFNAEEYENLFEKVRLDLKKKIINKNEILLKIFGTSISIKEILDLYNNEILSPSIMTFFLKYLEWSEIYKYNDKPKTKNFYVGVFFDNHVKNETEMNFLPGLNITDDLNDFYENFRNLILCFQYDERWILSIINSDEKKCGCDIIDFLDNDLCMNSKTDLIDLIKMVINGNGDFIRITNFTILKKYAINSYLDFGLHICAFLEKFSINFNIPEKLKIYFPGDQQKIKEKIIWLILKLATNKKNNL